MTRTCYECGKERPLEEVISHGGMCEVCWTAWVREDGLENERSRQWMYGYVAGLITGIIVAAGISFCFWRGM